MDHTPAMSHGPVGDPIGMISLIKNIMVSQYQYIGIAVITLKYFEMSG